jgi:hypothetical protein
LQSALEPKTENLRLKNPYFVLSTNAYPGEKNFVATTITDNHGDVAGIRRGMGAIAVRAGASA